MEFKNLAEVTKLTEVPEGTSVLAATAEGEVVRVPGDGLGGSGGGADWNAVEGEPGYIANKPDISGGSGGGGAGGGVFVVRFTSVDDGQTFTIDKTYAEIREAIIAGVPVIAMISEVMPGYEEYGIYGQMSLCNFYDEMLNFCYTTVKSDKSVYSYQFTVYSDDTHEVARANVTSAL